MNSLLRLGRQIRSELRLYRRPAVLALAAVYGIVVAVLLIVGQAYSRDQVQAAQDQRVDSCATLRELGVPTSRCSAVRASQQGSVRSMHELAGEIGPAGAASHRPFGVVAIVIGHAATGAGLTFLAAVAALVLGEEAEAGIRPNRQVLLGGSNRAVRAAGLGLAWLAATGVVAVMALAANAAADIDQPWRGAVGSLGSGSVLLSRLVGAAVVGGLAATALAAIAEQVPSRPRLLVAGLGLGWAAVAMAALEGSLIPPTNALWSLLRFGPMRDSAIDRLPFGIDQPALGLAGSCVVALAILGALRWIVGPWVQARRS